MEIAWFVLVAVLSVSLLIIFNRHLQRMARLRGEHLRLQAAAAQAKQHVDRETLDEQVALEKARVGAETAETRRRMLLAEQLRDAEMAAMLRVTEGKAAALVAAYERVADELALAETRRQDNAHLITEYERYLQADVTDRAVTFSNFVDALSRHHRELTGAPRS